MHSTDATFYDDHFKRKKVVDYIHSSEINRQSIKQYCGYFPDKVCRTLVESDLIYEIA